MSNIIIKPLARKDYDQWFPLWDGNNMGQQKDDVTQETWRRINDRKSDVNGFAAWNGETMVGFLHYILHPTTGAIEPVCYMQDVYVDPECRNQGIARKLVQALITEGKKQKWTRLYWLAEADNEAAQALYKNIGVKLNFTLHVQPIS